VRNIPATRKHDQRDHRDSVSRMIYDGDDDGTQTHQNRRCISLEIDQRDRQKRVCQLIGRQSTYERSLLGVSHVHARQACLGNINRHACCKEIETRQHSDASMTMISITISTKWYKRWTLCPPASSTVSEHNAD
jgi:hypothetical protein